MLEVGDLRGAPASLASVRTGILTRENCCGLRVVCCNRVISFPTTRQLRVYRQIIGYIPSNVIPAIVSVLMIYAYTRLLSPAAFGNYSYVFSAVLVLQTSLFYALPIAVMRFFPGNARAGRGDGLLKEAYVVFYSMCLAVALIGACAE